MFTASNLFSEGYEVIKNFINSNITDPKGRYKKNWIHPSIPNITDQSFDGYPFITLALDVSEKDKSFDRRISNKIFRILIGIYSDQATEVDEIADEIVSKFKDETLTNSLNDFGVLELSSSPFDVAIVGTKKIHQRIIGIRGVMRIW